MTPKKVWFITGAGRGMGADFARAVLAAGRKLVATGRDPERVAKVLGPSDALLAVKLDVTRSDDAQNAVKAAVERFGRIDVLVNNTTIVNPGFFRTELLTEQSTSYAEPSIADYDERRAPLLEYWKAQNGQQSGDPAKLAHALLTIASQEPPPRRFIAGADAIATTERKVADLRTDIESNRELSTSLDFEPSFLPDVRA